MPRPESEAQTDRGRNAGLGEERVAYDRTASCEVRRRFAGSPERTARDAANCRDASTEVRRRHGSYVEWSLVIAPEPRAEGGARNTRSEIHCRPAVTD